MKDPYAYQGNSTVPVQTYRKHQHFQAAIVERHGTECLVSFPLFNKDVHQWYRIEPAKLKNDTIFGQENWEMVRFELSMGTISFLFKVVTC